MQVAPLILQLTTQLHYARFYGEHKHLIEFEISANFWDFKSFGLEIIKSNELVVTHGEALHSLVAKHTTSRTDYLICITERIVGNHFEDLAGESIVRVCWKRYRTEAYAINTIKCTCCRIWIHGASRNSICNTIYQSKLSNSLIGLWGGSIIQAYVTLWEWPQWQEFELSNEI
jgi:hypothetical protein